VLLFFSGLPLLASSVIGSTLWCHVTCAFIGTSYKLGAYKQPRNKASCQYELADVIEVCSTSLLKSPRGGSKTKAIILKGEYALLGVQLPLSPAVVQPLFAPKKAMVSFRLQNCC